MPSGTAEQELTDQVKAKVFISYSRKDGTFVDRLDLALKAHGFEPLVDRSEIYAFEDWWKRIQALIVQADTIIFVLSPDAVTSEVCAKEIDYATSLNKRFAPVVCRRVDEKLVPEALGRLNFIFLDDETLFAESFNRLCDALATDIDWIRAHTQYGEAARHWAGGGRPAGLLLRSPALEEAERWIASRPASAPAPTDETQVFIAQSRRGTTRRRNLLVGSLAAGLVLALALAALAYWQRGYAVTQERVAERERNLAIAQRDRALVTQSRFLVDLAQQRLKADNAGAALLLATEALPDKSAGIERPYVREAEETLFLAMQGRFEAIIIDGTGPSLDPGMTRVAVGGATVKIHDLRDGRPLVTFEDHTAAPPYVAQFSPDGKRVVTLGGDNTGRVMDAETGRLLTLVPHLSTGLQPLIPGSGISFSHDGDLVLLQFSDGAVGVWEVATGRQVVRLPESEGPAAAILSPDGRHFVTMPRPTLAAMLDIDNIAKVWDTETGHLLLTVPLKLFLGKLCFSPDGRQLATSSDNMVQIWDIGTAKQLFTLQGHIGTINQISYSPDGRRIITASDDKTARIWDAKSGTAAAVLTGHAGAVRTAEFTSDGRRAVTWSTDRSMRTWDLQTSTEITPLRRDIGPLPGVLLPDGRLLTSGTAVQIWQDNSIIFSMHKKSLRTAAFSPDSRYVVSTAADGARVWDAQTAGETARFEGDVLSATFRPDGRHVFMVVGDKVVDWDAMMKTEPVPLIDFGGSVADASFDRQANRVALTSATLFKDGLTAVYDLNTRTAIILPKDLREGARLISISPDGRRLAAEMADETVHIWDIETERAPLVLEPEAGSTPLLFAGTRVLRTNAIAFSPDGRRVAIDGLSGIIVYDARTGEALIKLAAAGVVNSIVFSPDGGHLIVASKDPAGASADTAPVFDAASGSLLGELSPHGGGIGPVAYSPDGKRIVLILDQRIARVLPAFESTQALIDHAKQVIQRCLTRAERLSAFLDPEPLPWCIELGKWPYRSQAWRDWLAYKRANADPPLPDTPEWERWRSAH